MWWKVNGRAMTAETWGARRGDGEACPRSCLSVAAPSQDHPAPPRCSRSSVQPHFLAVALNNSRLCPDPAGLAHGPAPSVPYPPSEVPAPSEAGGMRVGRLWAALDGSIRLPASDSHRCCGTRQGTGSPQTQPCHSLPWRSFC